MSEDNEPNQQEKFEGEISEDDNSEQPYDEKVATEEQYGVVQYRSL